MTYGEDVEHQWQLPTNPEFYVWLIFPGRRVKREKQHSFMLRWYWEINTVESPHVSSELFSFGAHESFNTGNKGNILLPGFIGEKSRTDVLLSSFLFLHVYIWGCWICPWGCWICLWGWELNHDGGGFLICSKSLIVEVIFPVKREGQDPNPSISLNNLIKEEITLPFHFLFICIKWYCRLMNTILLITNK